MKVSIVATAEDIAAFAARSLAEAAEARGGEPFRIALSGGSTPKDVYCRLADEYRDAIDWSRLHVFFVDERPVSPADPASNFRLASEHWLSRVPVPEAQVHRMKGEADDLDAAARAYEDILRNELPMVGDVPLLDFVWLGMGADGHTASLFPATAALAERDRWVVANVVPPPIGPRLTLTYPVLEAARRVQFLVTGLGKAEAVAQVLRFRGQRPGRERPPAAAVNGEQVEWVIDRPAASELGDELAGG